MHPEQIRLHLHRQRFEPIRVFMSDGSYYDVPHADFMLVSRREVVIGISPAADQLPERNAYLDPGHIARIESINGKVRRAGGRKKKTR